MSLYSTTSPLETLTQTQYAHAFLNELHARKKAIANRNNDTGKFWLDQLNFWQLQTSKLGALLTKFDVTDIRTIVIWDAPALTPHETMNKRYQEAMFIALAAFKRSIANK